MSNKKTIVLCQLFYPELISTGLTLTELCERLSEKGLELEVICAHPTIHDQKEDVPQNITYKNIHIHRLWSTRFPKLNIVGKLLNHLSYSISLFFYCLSLPKNSQLLVLTNPPIMPLLLRLLFPIKRFRYTLLLFDLYPETLTAAGLLSKWNPIVVIWKKLNQSIYDRATHIIAIGRCMQNIVSKYIPKEQHHKLHYIPIWSDDKTIHSNKKTRNFRKDWNCEKKFIVGYSGNLARFHPIETMMKAAKTLKDNSEIAFIFVGEGAKKAWAQAYAKKHQLPNCQFHSYVPREELGALLQSFDCGLVGLSPKHTGCSVPSKTMGLIAAHTPPIACMDKHSDIALILEDYNCGIVVSPDNENELSKTLKNLQKNNTQLKQYQANCKTAAKALSLDSISKQYLQLLS